MFGLYFLKVDLSVNKQIIPTTCGAGYEVVSSQSCFVSESSSDKDVMVWHYRLGHLNFPYLSKIFPLLFRNKNPLHFQCEVCQLAKHTRSTYPLLSHHVSKPFSMIHSDV